MSDELGAVLVHKCLQNMKGHIRIFNGFEGQIENSVKRITVRHNKAYLVMSKNYRE